MDSMEPRKVKGWEVKWDSGYVHTGEKNRKGKQALTYKLDKRIERAQWQIRQRKE
jgi:hypothetical protein